MPESTANPFLFAFETPEPEHTACPLWFWNGDLRPEEIVRQIGLMFNQGIRCFVIHPRVGITVSYLSETWFERVQVALEEASRRSMKVWIYDEDNWPSGYAGGRVLARDPSFVAQNLALERHYLEAGETLDLPLERPEEIRAIVACRLERIEALPVDPLTWTTPSQTAAPWWDTEHFLHVYADQVPTVLETVPDTVTVLEAVLLEKGDERLRWTAPQGRWCAMIFRQGATHWTAAYSDEPYVDLLNGAATAAFLEETHQQYWTRFAPHFGSTVLGFFVDEPGFYNNFWTTNVETLTWTHDLAEQFEQRRGYALLPWLPALWQDLGTRSTSVRLDYWRTVAELLEERFFGKLAGWCAEHGVLLTGHLHFEEFMFVQARNSVNPFTALASFQVPGVDKIDEVTRKISEKLVASVAHAHGRSRVLSETYALTSWKLAPPYMKQILDYQLVRGINWIVPHGFYYSIEDYRQRECPPSEFFQNPWWDHSGPFWNHLTRLSATLSQGLHVAPVLLYYPIEQAHATLTPTSPKAMPPQHLAETWQLPQPHLPVQRTDLSCINLSLHLLEQQWDFDLADHTTLASARLEGSQIRLGNESFRAVVVPALEVIQAHSLQTFLALAENGGALLFVNHLPTKVLEGEAPAAWSDLRGQLSRLNRPEWVRFGSGWVGLVPEGLESVGRLLGTVIQPDLKLEIARPMERPDERWQFSLENRQGVYREARIQPLSCAVKYHRRHAEGQDLYFVVNESSQGFEATLELVGGACVEAWIPHSGEQRTLPSQIVDAGRVRVSLTFEPWQSHLLRLSPGESHPEPQKTRQVTGLELTDWTLELEGEVYRGQLENWSVLGHSRFSGKGTYTTAFDWAESSDALDSRVTLDLGVVLETAEVIINGTALPPLAWFPYRTDLSSYLQEGRNQLTVRVANSNANAFEGRERPSGLFGPVRLQQTQSVHE